MQLITKSKARAKGQVDELRILGFERSQALQPEPGRYASFQNGEEYEVRWLVAVSFPRHWEALKR